MDQRLLYATAGTGLAALPRSFTKRNVEKIAPQTAT